MTNTLDGAPTLAAIETARSISDEQAKIQAAHEHNTLINARMRLREKLSKAEAIRLNYLAYLKDRIFEEDWHGTWDAGCNIAENLSYQQGLREALEELGG